MLMTRIRLPSRSATLRSANGKREQSPDFGAEVLKEFRHDRQAADNDADSHFCPGPDTDQHYIVANVRGLGHSPAVEGAKDRRYAGTGNASQLPGRLEARNTN